MKGGSLRIAWLGPVPGVNSGAPGVATDLLDGLAKRGHRIDCFFAGASSELPMSLRDRDELTFTWAGTGWKWDRWYSRTSFRAFITGLWSRATGFLRLRRQVAKRHASEPYDVVYQFSNIEPLGAPRSVLKSVPLVIHPSTHAEGELRWLIVERQLGRHSQRFYQLLAVATVLAFRALVQRVSIKRAQLLICISSSFRDHLVDDYHYPVGATIVIPYPVRLDRFDGTKTSSGHVPTVLVLGRIALRKGVDQIVALSHILRERGIDVEIKIVGSRSQWSDYLPLLEKADPRNTTYVGHIDPAAVALALTNADVLVQASKYEPFGLTVAEALAAGTPVVASEAVGAVEAASGPWIARTAVGDADGLADAVEAMLERLREDPESIRQGARMYAESVYSPDGVCASVSEALTSLAQGWRGG